MDPNKQPGITLQTVFLKEASFNHRGDPLAELPVEMQTDQGKAQLEITLLASSSGQMAVGVRASHDPNESNARYEFSVEMIAIFAPVVGNENMPVADFALRNGGALVYPFVREAVANITSRGRFGPIWLNPINIVAMLQAGDELAKRHPPPTEVATQR